MTGDAEAFAALAGSAANRLYAVALAILRDPSMAEDATQDAIVLAWRDLSALRDPVRFDAWLHRVLVRECYKHAQRARRRIAIENQVRPVRPDDEPFRQTVVRDELARAFAQLSVDHRTVLVLHQYVGYTFAEIGTVLGVAPGTVKSRYSRALAAMRSALEAAAQSPPPQKGGMA